MAAAIDPGELKHRVLISQLSATPNAFGERVTYSQVTACWAGIRRISMASERTHGAAAKQTSQVQLEVTIRYQPVTIAAGMRLSLKGSNYTIEAVDNVEQTNTWLKLLVFPELR